MPGTVAASNSSAGGSGDAKEAPATWPQNVAMRLKELEAELEEEEITKKGFYKQKWTLVEPHLNKVQLKEAQALLATQKEGKVSDKDYFKQLDELLVPLAKSKEVMDEPMDEEEALIKSEEDSPKAKGSQAWRKKAKNEKDDEGGAGPSGSGEKTKKIEPEKGQRSIKDMFSKGPAKRKVEPKDEANSKRKSSEQDESANKKPKVEGEAAEDKTDEKIKTETSKNNAERCKTCRQLVDSEDTPKYTGHPHEAVEEFVGISHKSLSLFEDDGDYGEESTMQYKLTHFTVYDKQGHIVPFDTNLIEKNKEIFFSGYLKHLTCEDPGIEGGVPVFDCGPINAWWNAGFDGGERPLTGFTTSFAEYYIMEPSEMYAPLMKDVHEKTFITKTVIEYLEKSAENNEEIEYEDLMNHMSQIVPPDGMDTIGDETLIRHADFVVNQVYSYEDAGDDDEELELVKSPCMRAIIKLAGIKLSERRKLVAKKPKQMKQPKFMMATVTNLVKDVFHELFKEQIAEAEGDEKTASKKRKKRCGVCETCMKVDCGQCTGCKGMTKFGGNGKAKQACEKRKCPNMGTDVAEEESMSEGEEEEKPIETKVTPTKTPTKKSKVQHSDADVKWEGEGEKIKRKTYYKSAVIGGEFTVANGDTVLISPEDPSTPLYVASVVNMYEKDGEAMAHLQWFCRGTDTCLGEASDPSELFYIDDCEDQPLLSVLKKCSVERKPVPNQADWMKLGGSEPPPTAADDGENFWVSLWYGPEHARFEYPKDLPLNKEDKVDFCGVCVRCKDIKMSKEPVVGEESDDGTYTSLTWDYALLKVGDCVYLTPGSVNFKIKQKPRPEGREVDQSNVDEDLYPEYYRKSNYIKGNNAKTPDPFQLALIKSIIKRDGEVKLKVQIFYRPENTHKGRKAAESADLNMVYWSEEDATVPFKAVQGRCFVKFADLKSEEKQLRLWAEEGADRWYFREMYNAEDKSMDEPPLSAQRFGQKGAKGKGKGKGKSSAKTEEDTNDKQSNLDIPSFPPVTKKLRCLDVFAGCGGLSQGLHEAGVAESKWAIEVFEQAAQAYKLNNKDCTVFTDDCNLLLKNAIEGIKVNAIGQKIPQPGEVDLLCGGPPCQGFSGMNRFNHREYSQFKNSLVSTYLSYLEFYRPKYFILENVRNFASFKKSMVLRLCMRSMIKMGYQCTFGILQAGQFGVAQTRRRAILLAAAPGETLPLYPEPRYVFSPQACHLSVEIEDRKYFSNARWVNAGPYRTITVRDTLSDLPKIKNGHSKVEASYNNEANSHFQKKIRGDCQVLRDHICKDMSALVECRMGLIPVAPGSDWRDLPNSVVTLKDGNKTRKLVYGYNDCKQGRSSTGTLRGVCSCSNGKEKCDPADRQQNTLIPWCLPHTSNRHNQWAGLYGRVEMDGFFSTTITNPEPMGKQGRVLHPEQSRVVSVRECARSQGFPDSYKFYGSTLDKHRQVGNAVAPPMGKYLGLEIRIAMGKTRDQDKPKTEEEKEKASE